MSISKEIESRETYRKLPTESEIIDARNIFARPGELFVKNILIDPFNPKSDNIEKVKEEMGSKYPAFDLRYGENYIVDPYGLILDSKNFARWNDVPEGNGYAVYARPKGTKLEINTPEISKSKVNKFIKVLVLDNKFLLIKGNKDWKEMVIDNLK